MTSEELLSELNNLICSASSYQEEEKVYKCAVCGKPMDKDDLYCSKNCFETSLL